MADSMSNPKTSMGTGSGSMQPYDREFNTLRLKARAVLEGRASFTFDELCKVIARMLEDRG